MMFGCIANYLTKKESAKKLKDSLCLFLIVISIFALSSDVTGATSYIAVNVNGMPLKTDVAPVIIDGRTMIPLRAIFEALDAEVQWDGETGKITGTKGKTLVILHLNSKHALINGKSVYLDVPPALVNGRTMVPGRFIAESLGAQVGWNNHTRTVNVNLAVKDGLESDYSNVVSVNTKPDFTREDVDREYEEAVSIINQELQEAIKNDIYIIYCDEQIRSWDYWYQQEKMILRAELAARGALYDDDSRAQTLFNELEEKYNKGISVWESNKIAQISKYEQVRIQLMQELNQWRLEKLRELGL